MRAAVIRQKGVISVEEVPLPEPGPDEALLKVHYCGICGSDVRMFAEGFFPQGLVIGHEFCGHIHALGGKSDEWNIGDRVTVMPAMSCGSCTYCRQGQRHHCRDSKILGVNEGFNGAFGEYVKIKTSTLYRLPDTVTDVEAANVEPCAVSLRAVRRSGIALGDVVAIFGAGSIGLFVLQCARLAGAGSIYVAEPARGRAEVAERLGADRILDPANPDFTGDPSGSSGQGVDIAFVCTAAPQALEQAVQSTRCQGKVVLVGGGLSAQVVPEYWMWKEIEVKGSFAYLEEFGLALDLFARGEVTVDGLISETVSLEELQGMMLELAHPSGQIKVLVQPDR
ncbi:MAG: alcohol dehydrogenase catalytic domain-containing protein [Dehalococcoidia bacterium]